MDEKGIEAVDELTKLKTQYLEKVKNEGQDLLKKEFRAFFAANPDVEAIAWRQYTPYFNDGDACEFSVHDFNFRLKGSDFNGEIEVEDFEDFSYGEEHPWYTTWNLGPDAGDDETPEDFKKKLVALEVPAREFVAKFRDHDDLMEMTFGDHVKVIATPEKFIVEEAEHE